MIDLFRPYVDSEQTARMLARTLAAQPDGRKYIGQGAVVAEFERQLAVYMQSPRDVLTVNSGTSALDLAYHLCGLTPDNDAGTPGYDLHHGVVISTPMTCTATNVPIATRGGRVAWADVDPYTGLISPASVAARIRALRASQQAPVAVVAVDWGGSLCDYAALRRAILEANDGEPIPIIQDAAHSFGALFDGKPFMATDQHGDYVCFSFQAIKHLTTGDGGALICPDAETTERARLLRWYGLDRTKGDKFRCELPITEAGYKYHMNDIAATIGLSGLVDDVNFRINKHRQRARLYDTVLRNIDGIRLVPCDSGSSYWLYTIQVDRRDELISYLDSAGVMASPVHARNDTHPAFKRIEALATIPQTTRLPGVDTFAGSEVAIPCGWWLTDADVLHIVETLSQWSAKRYMQPLKHPAALSDVNAGFVQDSDAQSVTEHCTADRD